MKGTASNTGSWIVKLPQVTFLATLTERALRTDGDFQCAGMGQRLLTLFVSITPLRRELGFQVVVSGLILRV